MVKFLIQVSINSHRQLNSLEEKMSVDMNKILDILTQQGLNSNNINSMKKEKTNSDIKDTPDRKTVFSQKLLSSKTCKNSENQPLRNREFFFKTPSFSIISSSASTTATSTTRTITMTNDSHPTSICSAKEITNEFQKNSNS